MMLPRPANRDSFFHTALWLVFFTLHAVSAACAVELHNWRFPFYRIASDMDLVSSSPSAMFWDDLAASTLWTPALWPDSALLGRNHWFLEPALAVGTDRSDQNTPNGPYATLEVLNDLRYRNLLVRQTLHADRRYDDDPYFPAHPDRWARGRIEEAYCQLDWRYGFFRFGRLLRNWGPFVDRSLLVSSNPYSYDAFELQVHSTLFEFRHLFAAFVPNAHSAFNQTADNGSGRFFAAHALNLMLGKWVTIGVLESMVFRRSGGFPDFQFVNPFSIYSVLNTNQEGDGNLMLGLQWKVRPLVENLALKGQILLDDIQVDNKQTADKEPAHWAIDAGVYWRDCLGLPVRHLLAAGYQRRSEWVYTVSDKDMNGGLGYTYLSNSLGLPGNDGDSLWLGFSALGKRWWAAGAAVSYSRGGENTVNSRWRDSDSGNIQGMPWDWSKNSFPSGIVASAFAVSLDAAAYYKTYVDARVTFTSRWLKNRGTRRRSGVEFAPAVSAEICFHFSDFNRSLPK